MPFCVFTIPPRASLALYLSEQWFYLVTSSLSCLSGSITAILSLKVIFPQMISTTALFPHICLKILDFGQDSDYAGGKSTFCIRSICFLWTLTALSKFTMQFPPSDIKFTIDCELIVLSDEKVEELCAIHKPKEKSYIQMQIASNYQAVSPLICP